MKKDTISKRDREVCKFGYHSFVPIHIDEYEGFVIYVCSKCGEYAWKETTIIEHITNMRKNLDDEEF